MTREEEAATGLRADILRQASALRKVAGILDGREWDSDTLDMVAQVVREAGLEVRSPEDM